MNAKQLAKQREWSAKRAAKLGRPHPLNAAPAMLTVGTHEPDAADYARLLAEAGDYRGAVESVVAGDDPEIYVPGLPKQFLGRTVVAAWLRGLPADKLRALVTWAWGLGTPYVVEAVGCRLFDMLRACEWPLPADLSDEVTVWRAARGVTIEQAGRGLSWTLDRDTACAWLRILEVNWSVKGTPVVIRRTVPRSAIAMYHEPGHLAEVVIDAPPGGDLDGTPSEWGVARDRWRDRMVAEGKMSMHDYSGAEDATCRVLGVGLG